MYLVSHYHPQDTSIELGAHQGLSEALEDVVNRIAVTLQPDTPDTRIVNKFQKTMQTLQTTPPNSKSSIDSTCGEDVVRIVSQHDGLHRSMTVHVLKHDERVLDELRLAAVIAVGPPQFGDMKLT